MFEWYDQLVAQTLVRPLSVIVRKILTNCIARRPFTEKNQAIETLGFE